MMRIHLPTIVALPLVLALALPACTASVQPTPAPVDTVAATEPNGTLIIDWTIELRKDPTDCRLAGADAIRIHVVSQSGVDAGTYVQDCGVFSTSIPLQPGTYNASAELMASGNVVRSTSVVIAPFSLFGNDQLTIPIDFPASSLY